MIRKTPRWPVFVMGAVAALWLVPLAGIVDDVDPT